MLALLNAVANNLHVNEGFIIMMMIRCIKLVLWPLVGDQKRIEFAKLARLNPEAS